MSGGGGQNTNTITKSDPWAPAQPYLLSGLKQAADLQSKTIPYYPGSTVVGPLQSEQNAFSQLSNASSNFFGPNGTGGVYGQGVGALSGALSGNNNLGSMAAQLSPDATSALVNGFNSGPQQVGRYGFDTTLNPYAMAPQFGQAGSLDARGALQQALSGTPDYAGAQGAIDAANAPLLRDFQQNVLPSLNSRATFLNNGTGGIKALGNILPDLGARMDQNALSVMEGERQRALAAQQSAAALVSQGGQQSYQLGLQGALGQAGLEQALAQQNLGTDTTNANLQQAYLGQLLGYGGLAGSLAGQSSQQQLSGIGLTPTLAQTGQMPGQTALQYANYDRATREDALNADIQRFNYNTQQPYNQLNWYSNLINGTAGQGGGQNSSMTGSGLGPSRAASALGGGLSGAMLGSMIAPATATAGGAAGAAAGAQAGASTGTPWGALIGAGLGLLGGYLL